MKADTLHENLLTVIKEKTPQGVNLANALADILYIGKEAIYRRIRGEVPFTFFEISTISEKLNISVDSIIGTSVPNNAIFHLGKNRYVDPVESDYLSFIDSANSYKLVSLDPNSEVGSSCNRLPNTFTMKYDNLCKFRSFQWMYQHNKIDSVKPFHKIIIPEKLSILQREFAQVQQEVSKTIYIWDSMIFSYLVNDIKYFNSVQLLMNEDVQVIKEELLQLLDELETIAAKGQFETGNKVQMYISNINFETNYTYVQSENHFFSIIFAFTLNGLGSYDKDIFEDIKNLIKAQQRLSTLISESGEIQRVRFFNNQRTLIESL